MRKTTHIRPKPPSFRNQAANLQFKSLDWFVYDGEH